MTWAVTQEGQLPFRTPFKPGAELGNGGSPRRRAATCGTTNTAVTPLRNEVV